MKTVLILIVCFYFLCSCNSSRSISDTKNENITLTLTPCGSYEVKQKDDVLGYVVNSFCITDSPYIKTNVSLFENVLMKDYSKHYDQIFRVYYFSTTHNNKDTIIVVRMLTKKQVSLIDGNWKCENLDIDAYKTRYSYKSSKKYPPGFIFNCSKRLFISAYDPSL